MKDSGIDWLGKIPADWETKKMRYATKLRNESGYFSDGAVYIGLENIEGSTGRYIQTETEYADGFYDIVKKGDVLFGKLRPYLEKVYISEIDGFCTGEFLNFKYFEGAKRYLYYFLLSHGFIETVNSSTYGAKMPRAEWDFIKNLKIPVPPLKEQQAIAAFLDTQCGRIDSIVAEMERQIEVLKFYKTSLITETVTKGLDKTAPMKDSGIDWLGKIPADWGVKKIKFICDLKTGSTPANNEGINTEGTGYNWYTPSDFNSSLMLKESERYIENAIVRRDKIRLCKGNSVLIVGIGATVGKIGYCIKTSYCNQQVTAMIPQNIEGKYLLYFMFSQTNYIKNNALYTTLPIINNSYLENRYCLLPPIQEQQAIAVYLDKKCNEIADIIKEKRQSMETMRAYKKSLIYEYVTGKKRIAGYA
jgi:type I restriction enzyme S subunit